MTHWWAQNGIGCNPNKPNILASPTQWQVTLKIWPSKHRDPYAFTERSQVGSGGGRWYWITTPRIAEGSIWMQESNVGKLWVAAKWATELPTHSSCVHWIDNTHNPPLPLQVLSYCCGVELQWSSADLNRNFSFSRSHFFEFRPQWVSSHIETFRSKCLPPQLTTQFFQSAPKSVPIECHHISHCFAILYSMN
jgi:hypothetical protein